MNVLELEQVERVFTEGGASVVAIEAAGEWAAEQAEAERDFGASH